MDVDGVLKASFERVYYAFEMLVKLIVDYWVFFVILQNIVFKLLHVVGDALDGDRNDWF